MKILPFLILAFSCATTSEFEGEQTEFLQSLNSKMTETCYKPYVKSFDLSGSKDPISGGVDFLIEIDSNGKVTSLSQKPGTRLPKQVTKCLTGHIRKETFPQPTSFRHTLEYRASFEFSRSIQ